MTPPFRMAVCGLEELEGHCETAATHVLSILDPDFPVPEAFGQYGEHERLELRFTDIVDATPGAVLPSPEHVESILAFGRAVEAEPDSSLLVHCHAGISRSTASLVLILAQAMPAMAAPDVLEAVHTIREKAWPNIRMIELGDALLGRGGALVAATTALHKSQLVVRPRLAEFMTGLGRGREVKAAQAAQ